MSERACTDGGDLAGGDVGEEALAVTGHAEGLPSAMAEVNAAIFGEEDGVAIARDLAGLGGEGE